MGKNTSIPQCAHFKTDTRRKVESGQQSSSCEVIPEAHRLDKERAACGVLHVGEQRIETVRELHTASDFQRWV